MKAMILAAGKGERMLPLTVHTPKPLLKVHGEPLIVHHLRALARAGVTEVIINLWHLGEKIKTELGSGAEFGLQIHYLVETKLLNTGGGIMNALPVLGNGPFIVLSADIYSNFPLMDLTIPHASLAHLVLVDNPSYHVSGDFALHNGMVELSGTKNLTYANIGIFKPEFFASAPQGPFALGTLLREQIANGKVSGQHYAGNWFNVGTPMELELVNNTL